MSSGTQVDMDWAGIDVASGGSAAPAASDANGAGAATEKYLTDEEILGIEPVGESAATARDAAPSGARNSSGNLAGGETQQRDSSGKTSFRNDNVAGAPRNGDAAGAPNSQTGGASETATAAGMPDWMAAAAGDPQHGAEAQRLWQEHQAFRASFSSPEEARAIKELFPGGAQEAQTLRQAAQAVDQLDAAIYSGDARAQSQVVAELARANPAAFRQLFSEAAKVLAGLGQDLPLHQTDAQMEQRAPGSNQNPTLRQNREEWAAQQTSQPSWQQAYQQNSQPTFPQTSDARSGNAASPRNFPGSEDPGYNHSQGPVANQPSHSLRTSESPVANQQSPVTGHQSPPFDPAAYAAFERSTNDAVARDVRGAVGETLTRVLPDGIAEAAARRIGDDIFNEIHRTLAADRTLSEQIGEILRGSSREAAANGWRFGMAEQQRVASLLAARAKQLVPGVARRVIGEWTSSVLGASRSKAARQTSAASRVDIAAAGGSRDSMPLRAMSNREIDYASMSDDQILGM